MAYLSETANALRSFPASQDYMFGLHEGNEPRAGIAGRNVGEVPYDPVKHSPLSINPLSVWEQALGIPHVPVNIPPRPLNVNIVVHQPESLRADRAFNYGENRRWLSRLIGESIAESMPGLTDRTWLYAVGERAEELTDPDAEILVTGGDSEEEARMVAEICKEGLTFVISDFLHLPVNSLSSSSFPATVAVKTNLPIDLGLSEKGLVMRTNDRGGEIDLSKKSELAKINGAMARLHEETLRELTQSGLAVATVLFCGDKAESDCFEVPKADLAIARAVERVSATQA